MGSAWADKIEICEPKQQCRCGEISTVDVPMFTVNSRGKNLHPDIGGLSFGLEVGLGILAARKEEENEEVGVFCWISSNPS